MSKKEQAIEEFYNKVERGDEVISVCAFVELITPYQKLLKKLQEKAPSYIYFERKTDEAKIINKKTNSRMIVKNNYYDCRGEHYRYILLLDGVTDNYVENRIKGRLTFQRSEIIDLRGEKR